MAKKTKVSSNELGLADVAYSPSMYVDLDDVKEVKGLSVGDTVRIVIKGTIKSVEQRSSYDDESKTMASIGIKDFDAEIVKASSQFDSLFDDENDD